MPIGPLSQTTICLKSSTSSIQSDHLANCGSGPPPPQQQQQQQQPPCRSRRFAWGSIHLNKSFASAPSLAMGRASPASPRPKAFSQLAIKSPLLLLCP